MRRTTSHLLARVFTVQNAQAIACRRRAQSDATAILLRGNRTTWTSRPATSITWREVPYEQPRSHSSFLRPIEDLLLDPTVTEVMVNDGGRRVFVERDGTVESVRTNARNAEPHRRHQEHRRACGDEISDVQPLLDARSRTARALPPCSAVRGGGPS